MLAKTSTPRRIGIAALEERLAVERSTIWRWYTTGRFPAPHYVGKLRAWWLEQIEEWEATNVTTTTPPAVGQAVAP